MATNDTVLLSVRGLNGSTMHVHTLHFREGPSALGPAGLLTAWQGAPMTAYRAIFPTASSPTQLLKAQYICGTEPLPAALEVVPTAPNQLGSRATAGDLMPSFIACLVSEKTALAGKKYAGRFFMGGLIESDGSGNSIAAVYLALVQAYADALKAAFVTPATPDYRLVVHSRSLAAEPGTNCQDSSTPVSDLLVKSAITTMRSRKLGHGP